MKKIISDKKYVASLEVFLDDSHEDSADIDGILIQVKKVDPQFLSTLKEKKHIRILDVGSGNGAKALYLAKELKKMGITSTIDSIEPKATQRKHLRELHAKYHNAYLGKVFAKQVHEVEVKAKYDIILVIHCMYEYPRNTDDTLKGLNKLDRYLTDDGIGVFIIEDPQGDFQKMKRYFYPKFGKKSSVSVTLIKRTLKKADISYVAGESIPFDFSLTHVISQDPIAIGKNIGFLFSESLTDKPLHDEQYERVGKWVSNHVKEKKKETYLSTPDFAIWFFPRGV